MRCTDRQCAARTRLFHENENGARASWNRRAERTCHAIEFVEEETFGLVVYSECSECHETIGISSEYGSHLPRYCPHCGARVVVVSG